MPWLRITEITLKEFSCSVPKVCMHHHMSDVQPEASIVWCWATVQVHAPTLRHNSIQHTYIVQYNSKLFVNQISTIQGQNKLSEEKS